MSSYKNLEALVEKYIHQYQAISLVLESVQQERDEYRDLYSASHEKLEKAERERDELRKKLQATQGGAAEAIKNVMRLQEEISRLNKESQCLSDQLGACDRQRLDWLKRALTAEAEIARRDAAAGEPEFYVRYRSDGGYEGPLHKDATEECRKQSWSPLYTAAPPAASVNYPVIPEGWIPMPGKLTAENGAKAALSGDFAEHKVINCPECFGDDECESCDGSGRIKVEVIVSWSTIKAIWEKGAEHFATAPAPGGDCG